MFFFPPNHMPQSLKITIGATFTNHITCSMSLSFFVISHCDTCYLRLQYLTYFQFQPSFSSTPVHMHFKSFTFFMSHLPVPSSVSTKYVFCRGRFISSLEIVPHCLQTTMNQVPLFLVSLPLANSLAWPEKKWPGWNNFKKKFSVCLNFKVYEIVLLVWDISSQSCGSMTLRRGWNCTGSLLVNIFSSHFEDVWVFWPPYQCLHDHLPVQPHCVTMGSSASYMAMSLWMYTVCGLQDYMIEK